MSKFAVVPRSASIRSRAAAMSSGVAWPPGRSRWIGTKPSQRAARATGPAAGSSPPTQMGTRRGRPTGTGVNLTGPTV